ncbi:MAG: SusC/RagA family TonB-linked outer membrane protein, partial [Paramuribaculum sp.]|nr:SusC/RagA family TonB-linked outer membrane protein [Paramuribaculum sp.]
RWGTFFSGSAGWRITQEQFMQSLVETNIVNNLKLRASYGETGLDTSAGRFAYLTSYTLNNQGYVVDGKFVPTFSEGALPSPDLTWYTTRQTDIGLDFGLLGSRLTGSVDYFYYSTKGYLVAPTGESYLNQVIGISMPLVKSDSEFRRAGWEFQLGWHDMVGDFSYDISANLTWYNSLWARIADEPESQSMNPYTRLQGRKQDVYGRLYNCYGFYNDVDEIYNSAGYVNAYNSGYMRPGDLRYEDTNGDGQITTEDLRYRGSQSTPHGQFGINISLNYKGFYLSALFQGSTKFDVAIPGSLAMQTGQTSQLPVIFDFQTDYWRPDNTNAKFPRLMSNTPDNSNNNYISSDFWLVNGQYIRLKDVQFGYDFKYKLLKNVNWLSRARIGFSGENLFTVSAVKKYGID